MNFVKPDRCFQVPIDGGELKISPSCDFMNHFPNDAWMLKYWDVEHEPPRMCNVFMNSASAQFLIDHCELEIVERKFMGEQEHSQWLGWASMYDLAELDFEPEIDDN